MNLTIVGSGYIGLTTGAVFAYLGHAVTCVDVDREKIDALRKGRLPIHEPRLQELLSAVRSNLHFTFELPPAVSNSEVIFLTVGTPSLADGSPDLQYVRQAAKQIGESLGSGYTAVVNKSTVPIGSGNLVESLIQDAVPKEKSGAGGFSVASNPEFLREGSALSDMFYPDRVVIGCDDARVLERLDSLYQPILKQDFSPPPFLPRPANLKNVPVLTTDLASAELIKYAANAFLSAKISLINEISTVAEKVGADVHQVAKGIGMDSRIGGRFLQAGIGWGGSCFGKDTAALIATAREYGITLPIIEAVREVNYRQRAWVIEKLLQELKILKGKTIGILGLAFKPDTDDIRDAPALDIARRLLDRGAKVKVHDPIAIPRVRQEYPDLSLTYCDSLEITAADADALVLATEWPQYGDLSWENLASKVRHRLVLDGRNALDRSRIEQAGFRYFGVGR